VIGFVGIRARFPLVGHRPGLRYRQGATFGHGHYGLSLSPMTGTLIADLISGGPLIVTLQAFRISRF
jgi:glycine/D-amino acid oxidase-like deaminating enzyme